MSQDYEANVKYIVSRLLRSGRYTRKEQTVQRRIFNEAGKYLGTLPDTVLVNGPLRTPPFDVKPLVIAQHEGLGITFVSVQVYVDGEFYQGDGFARQSPTDVWNAGVGLSIASARAAAHVGAQVVEARKSAPPIQNFPRSAFPRPEFRAADPYRFIPIDIFGSIIE